MKDPVNNPDDRTASEGAYNRASAFVVNELTKVLPAGVIGPTNGIKLIHAIAHLLDELQEVPGELVALRKVEDAALAYVPYPAKTFDERHSPLRSDLINALAQVTKARMAVKKTEPAPAMEERVTETPYWKHDCPDCIFLGRLTKKMPNHGGITALKNQVFDLYYCPTQAGGPTVIARFGLLGEYCSGMPFATASTVNGIPELFEAKKRALAKGLIK